MISLINMNVLAHEPAMFAVNPLQNFLLVGFCHGVMNVALMKKSIIRGLNNGDCEHIEEEERSDSASATLAVSTICGISIEV